MTEEIEIAQALEIFSSATKTERILRFRTEDGTCVQLKLSLSVTDKISDTDWDNAQNKFQDLELEAVRIFVDSESESASESE